jgi:hypothetical protein
MDGALFVRANAQSHAGITRPVSAPSLAHSPADPATPRTHVSDWRVRPQKQELSSSKDNVVRSKSRVDSALPSIHGPSRFCTSNCSSSRPPYHSVIASGSPLEVWHFQCTNTCEHCLFRVDSCEPKRTSHLRLPVSVTPANHHCHHSSPFTELTGLVSALTIRFCQLLLTFAPRYMGHRRLVHRSEVGPRSDAGTGAALPEGRSPSRVRCNRRIRPALLPRPLLDDDDRRLRWM